MKIVIDSNIFISALLKDGKVREIILINVANTFFFQKQFLKK